MKRSDFVCIYTFARLAHKLCKSGEGGSLPTEQTLFIPQCSPLGVRGAEKVPLALLGNPLINKLGRQDHRCYL